LLKVKGKDNFTIPLFILCLRLCQLKRLTLHLTTWFSAWVL